MAVVVKAAHKTRIELERDLESLQVDLNLLKAGLTLHAERLKKRGSILQQFLYCRVFTIKDAQWVGI